MIGGVLTYKRKGRKGVCGTTIGADGAGEYAFVIEGTPEEASAWAVAHVRNEEAGGARFENVTLVLAEECYSGPMLQIVTPNALGEGRERGLLREASSGEAATSTDGLGNGGK